MTTPAAASTTKPGETTQPAADTKPATQAAAEIKPAAVAGETKPAAATEPVKQPATEPARKEGASEEGPKAPAKYALTLPEGGRLDAADLAAFEKSARTNDWTQEEAQAALTEHATQLDALASSFLAATTADPDYGGDKLAETQRLANRAIDRLQPKGTPRGDALRSMLTKTGYGNHIAFVSLLAEVGKLMAEDSPVVGRSSDGRQPVKDPATVLYGGDAQAKT